VVELDADHDQPAHARLVGAPRRAGLRLVHRAGALQYEADLDALEREAPLQSEQAPLERREHEHASAVSAGYAARSSTVRFASTARLDAARSLVSRVRETRTHGSKGGPTHSPMSFNR
jgi:hypothetical protein